IVVCRKQLFGAPAETDGPLCGDRRTDNAATYSEAAQRQTQETRMAISLDTATRLSTDLVRVMKLFQSMRQHAPKLHPGVEPASYPILFNLLDGPRRVSLLADCVYSDVSTVSRQVTTLVSHGLLEKVADTHDGRAFMVSLSAEGIDLVERLKV